MNKQELIGKYKYLNHNYFRRVDTSEVLKDLKQLDEPQKVKVSEEEAKFLRTFDFNCESDVTTALYHVSRTGWGYHLMDRDGTELKDLSEGFRELENRKRLIKAILDGYEVEKEKRYTVTVKGDIKEKLLVYGKTVKRYFFTKDYDLYNVIYSHTRKQLEEAGFDWVFDCEGIEIEEVEE
nr:MAG TPA: Protein of unknown function (DUF1642) [Caudoviricetes sp.]